MMTLINGVVGIIILLLFTMGIFCNWVVKKKFNKMFATMENHGRDKHLLMIERDYRHGYLMNRVERLKVFAEREYYEIKICNIPLYAYEDFTISSAYLVVLLGVVFTLIQAALPHGNFFSDLFEIFFLSIEGLISGTILMLIRTVSNIRSLKSIFVVNLCNYLEFKLELFDEAERDEEGHLFFEKDYKENTKAQKAVECDDKAVELCSNTNLNVSEVGGNETESVEYVFDEIALLQVLEEILN